MKIDESELYRMLSSQTTEEDDKKYQLVDDSITDSDPEDGGADHTFIIKDLSSGVFYRGDYTDWDLENTDIEENEQGITVCGRCDLDTELQEVSPKEKQ